MTTSPSEKTGITLMLGSVVAFAVNTLMIRGLSLAVPAADGWVASLFRGVVGMLIVTAFFIGKGFQPKNLFTRPLLIARGLIGGFGILAFYITVVHLGAGRAVIINLSYPIFGCLFASLWLKETLPLRSWAWMGAGFVGLLVFLGFGLEHPVGRYDLLALAGAVAAGIVITLIRQLRHTEHTATIYASQCLASALFAALPAAQPASTLPPTALLIMTVAAVLVGLAQLSMTHAYRSLSVARGSSIQMILPLVTALGGWAFFDETFTLLEIAGGALTLLATWRVVATPKLIIPQPLKAAA
ncbi:drug/metabolite transporter (DMT)-like permease [Haloferula luteola]|uniref:Drug/metabolite transporter (DMT)-like permease n=1 Tax=Haloferula luteola TaxID=595692 RepID=A0A840V583_9BACT|nr:DMT family transporter [Haloferula luteola]MBB5352773.1 drug/metabolite transporter (DMT)-like permease [Haloferula luteola]